MNPPRSSTEIRAAWAKYLCNPAAMTQWRPYGSPWLVLVPPESLPIWVAYNTISAHYGYTFDEVAGGTYNCRKIAGTNTWSTHAYGVAIDRNPSRNPRTTGNVVTDLPTQMILDLEAIECNGRQALMWGGRWGNPDPMHHQLGVTPTEIAAGPITHPHDTEGPDDMPDIPCRYADGMSSYKGVTGRPHMREAVRRFMYRLEAIGVTVGDPDNPNRIDGYYGDDMAAAVLLFASAEDLKHPDTGATYDGKVIDATVDARLTRRYLEKIGPGAGDHDHAAYALKAGVEAALKRKANKNHPHEATTTID